MFRDPWPDLASMYPDACVHCAGMGRRIGWDSNGSITEELCECEKGNEMSRRQQVIQLPVGEGRPPVLASLHADVDLEPEAITADALMGARFEKLCETDAGESVYTREFVNIAQEVLFRIDVVLLNSGTSVRLATGRYSDSRKVNIATMDDLRTLVKFLGGAE